MNKDGKLYYKTIGGEEKEVKRPVGRPPQEIKYGSPNAAVFSINPQGYKTELVINDQLRQDENTILWGLDDLEPSKILSAIAESPTATNCIGKVELFIRGAEFTDPALMDMPINEDGETLWDLHASICQYYAQLDAFSVNFKYDQKGRIINTYSVPTEGCRFVAREETNEIVGIKYNPYWGTDQYLQEYTRAYGLFNPSKVKEQLAEFTDPRKYNGQIYFQGTKRTLYKHYPVPKFWSGKKWIYSDAKLATYIEKLLDNGFFESVLMKVIGDPNKMSQHPEAIKSVTGADGVIRQESYKTEGQMFNEMMGKNFSGVEKAGKVMALWSLNKDQAVTLEGFPSNVSDQLISTTLLENIRMVSLSTDVPAILANLPNSLSSLGSGGDAIKNAMDYMQAATASKRNTLEKFYNTVLLPNLQTKIKAEVKIKPFNMFNTSVTVDDKFWEFMNEAEKIDFITRNEPNIKIIRTPEASINTAPPEVDEEGNVINPAPAVPQVNEILKGLKVSEINRILSIVNKVAKGTLTTEQAKIMLAGYGLNEEQQNAFLNPTEV